MYRRMLIPKQALAMATLVVGHLLLFSPAACSSRPMWSPHLAGLRQLEAQTEGMTECLDALFQLRSCTNEIVLFFLNGDSYLGQDCCRAIRFITSTCWPAMFASIGFTPEEADILRGYCDATASSPPPAASPPTPSPMPSSSPSPTSSPTPSPTPVADHLV